MSSNRKIPKSGWRKYFITKKDNTTAICMYCSKELKTCSNTTNLKQHIERKHPTILQLKYEKFLNIISRGVDDIGSAEQVDWAQLDEFTKQITLSMRSNDARKLRRYLDGYIFKYAGHDYPLTCRQDNAAVYENKPSKARSSRPQVVSKRETYDMERSRSPNHNLINEEIRNIDLKIELVKKQRILIEEEAKLLLGKKKLEILKSIGPNDLEKLKKFEENKDLNEPDQLSELAMSSVWAEKPQPVISVQHKLPSFFRPLKVICAEMRRVIENYMTDDNRIMLMTLIRSTIKKRLLGVLEDKEFMATKDIIHLYRLAYPKATDNQLLIELTTTISQSCWPKKSNKFKRDGNGGLNYESNTVKTGLLQRDGNNENDIDFTADDFEMLNDSQVETENDVHETTLVDPDDVDDIVDMENDFDDWIEDTKGDTEDNGMEGANSDAEEEKLQNDENKTDDIIDDEKVAEKMPEEVIVEEKIPEEVIGEEKVAEEVIEEEKVLAEVNEVEKEEDKVIKDDTPEEKEESK